MTGSTNVLALEQARGQIESTRAEIAKREGDLAQANNALQLVLVGTTLSVLTERSRQAFKIQRWRHSVRNHTVVVGYGTKGRTAIDAMLGDGVQRSDIVVVDTDANALEAAANAGLVTVHGSATKSDVLRLTGVQRAASVVVAGACAGAASVVAGAASVTAGAASVVAGAASWARAQGAVRRTRAARIAASGRNVIGSPFLAAGER